MMLLEPEQFLAAVLGELVLSYGAESCLVDIVVDLASPGGQCAKQIVQRIMENAELVHAMDGPKGTA
jgi:hypothetical protein